MHLLIPIFICMIFEYICIINIFFEQQKKLKMRKKLRDEKKRPVYLPSYWIEKRRKKKALKNRFDTCFKILALIFEWGKIYAFSCSSRNVKKKKKHQRPSTTVFQHSFNKRFNAYWHFSLKITASQKKKKKKKYWKDEKKKTEKSNSQHISKISISDKADDNWQVR